MSGFVGKGRAEVTLPGEMVSVEAHRDGILSLLADPEPIELRLADALGLVLGEDVRSPTRLPAFASSAMDGYAVRAEDVAAATVEAPATLRVTGEALAGAAEPPAVEPGGAVRIMTGAPVPHGADAVVPVESTSGTDEALAVHVAPPAGKHVRPAGEDVTEGQPLVGRGRRLSPADLALLAAVGVSRVPAVPRPRVVVLSSGDELVRPEDTPGPGQLRDANGTMLTSLVRQMGGLPFFAGIVPDDRKALMYALDTNLGHADLFLATGGASAGTHDLLPEVIDRLGEVTTAKVAMQPGKPQIRGLVGRTPIIGLPGNPVSAFVSFEVFVRPALRRLQGRRDIDRPTITARAAEPMSTSPGRRGYLRVRLARDDDGWTARLTGPQGSNVLSSVAAADGLAEIPEDVDRVETGERVRVHLLVD